jgi:hypothetical protein
MYIHVYTNWLRHWGRTASAKIVFAKKIFFLIYSRKVQIKYIADTRLQERSQEKHMVVWL